MLIVTKISTFSLHSFLKGELINSHHIVDAFPLFFEVRGPCRCILADVTRPRP